MGEKNEARKENGEGWEVELSHREGFLEEVAVKQRLALRGGVCNGW